MVWELRAHLAFDLTRRFFKDGPRSGNKKYDAALSYKRGDYLAEARGIDIETAERKVAKRDLNQLQANSLLSKEARGTVPISPIQVGETRYNASMTYGNCGEMACVAMYIGYSYGVPGNQMVLATARNDNVKRWFGSRHMTFGHSWTMFGPPGDGWTIHPWAGVLCPQSEYKNALRTSLDQWFAEGKRIGVTWSDGSHAWMNANDEAVLGLIRGDARMDYQLGDEVRQLGKR